MKFSLCIATAVATAFAATAALAEITIGVSIGATGPGASLGVHYKNAFELMPKTLGGEPVRFIILENASDATNAAKNANKLVTEDKVDALVGSNGVPQTCRWCRSPPTTARRSSRSRRWPSRRTSTAGFSSCRSRPN